MASLTVIALAADKLILAFVAANPSRLPLTPPTVTSPVLAMKIPPEPPSASTFETAVSRAFEEVPMPVAENRASLEAVTSVVPPPSVIAPETAVSVMELPDETSPSTAMEDPMMLRSSLKVALLMSTAPLVASPIAMVEKPSSNRPNSALLRFSVPPPTPSPIETPVVLGRIMRLP